MTDLRDRLDALGRAGADGIRVTRRDLVTRRATGAGRRVWLPIGVVVATVAVVVGVVVWQGNEGTEDVVTTDGTATSASTSAPPATAPARTPMVAVALGVGGANGAPSTARIRFIGPDGSLIADRAWHEAEQPSTGGAGQWYASHGLLQRVPVGTTRIEIEDDEHPQLSCDTEVTADADSQLVVRAAAYERGVVAEIDEPCATVTTAAEWAAGGMRGEPTPPEAEPYLGLTREEAETKAKADGQVVRIVGEDGLDNAVTMEMRPDRVNLTMYDGQVIAASIG